MNDILHNHILEAARLRAGKSTWADVGRLIGRAGETCRQWPRRYPAIWAEADAPARAETPTPKKSTATPPRKPAARKRKPSIKKRDELPIQVDPHVPSFDRNRCHPPAATAQRNTPSPAAAALPEWLKNMIRADPQLLPQVMARARARQQAAMNARPALPLPVAPIGQPPKIAQPIVTPQPHAPRPYRISSINVVMVAITALSLGWAIGASMPGHGQSSEQRAKISPFVETMPTDEIQFVNAKTILSTERTQGVRSPLLARRAPDPTLANSVLPLDRSLERHYDFQKNQSFPPPGCDPTPRGLVSDWPPLIDPAATTP